MTSLRTAEGLDLRRVGNSGFGVGKQSLLVRSHRFIDEGKMILKDDKLILTKEGKLFADGITAELFIESL